MLAYHGLPERQFLFAPDIGNGEGRRKFSSRTCSAESANFRGNTRLLGRGTGLGQLLSAIWRSAQSGVNLSPNANSHYQGKLQGISATICLLFSLKQNHSYAKTRRFASSLRLGRLSCYSEDFAPDLKKDRGRSAPNNLHRPLSNPFVPAPGHSPTAPPSDKPFRYNRSVQNPVLIPSG
jgi:hypothetical protein